MFSDERNLPDSGAPTLASKPERWITPEEYLEADRKAEFKSEYLDGQVFAMSGASRRHNLIVGKLIVALGVQLHGRPCEVYPSDMRLRVPETGLYTYPDVTVVCGTPELQDGHFDILLNPTVLVEVLSESTERTDRGRKSLHYRRIRSLAQYLLVSQDEPLVESYRRTGEAEWQLTEAVGVDASVTLDSIGCTVELSELYEGIP
jgi:Uma2 family endonuclease